MIKQIKITAFKCLKDLALDLEPLNVLVGANDSGKSSVLQAIHFAVSIAQTCKLLNENPANEVSIGAQDLLYTPVHDLAKIRSSNIVGEDETKIAMQILTGENTHEAAVTVRPTEHRTIQTRIVGDIAAQLLQNLEHPYSIYVPGLSGLSGFERGISYGMLRRAVARGDANLVLRNVLRRLSDDPTLWQRFQLLLGSLFGQVEIKVEFDPKIDEFIEVNVVRNGLTLPLDACGTGLLQAIHITSYIALFEPRVLLLDEPDTHLHPNNQKNLVKLLSSIADIGTTQIVLTTHSRHIVDSIRDVGRVVWLSKSVVVDGVGTELTARLLELGAFDSIEHFVNGAAKCVVATEDKEKENVEAILWSSGFKKDETVVVSYLGASKIDAIKALHQFFSQKAPNLQLIVHRDRDYLSDPAVKNYVSELTKDGIEVFVTEQNDIEHCYIQPDLLVEKNPTLTAKDAEDAVAAAVAKVEEESKTVMINLHTEYAFRARKGKESVNHGEIALKCSKDYSANPKANVRGKLCLKALIALLHKKLGKDPLIVDPSSKLANKQLEEIAEKIWKK